MIRCPKCNRFSGDAAKVCFNCGYLFEKNHVNSSMSENKDKARNNNIKEESFNNRKYEDSYSKNNDTTQSFYYKSYQEEEKNIKEKEKVQEAIEKIKMQRKTYSNIQNEKKNFKRNPMEEKKRFKNPIMIFIGIFAIALVVIFAKFLLENVFIKNNFYGVYDIVYRGGLYDDVEEDISIFEEYSLRFNKDGTGELVSEGEGSKITSNYVWEKNGNDIIMTFENEAVLGGEDDLYRVKRQGDKIIVEDDYSDIKEIFQKR